MTQFRNQPAPTHVWVQHEETGGVWQCPADYLSFAEGRGWQVIDPPATDVSHLYDTPIVDEPEPTGFDPAEHTVAEVNEHLALHADQAPGEVERVLGLEFAETGKQRVTVVDPRPDNGEQSDGQNHTDIHPGD